MRIEGLFYSKYFNTKKVESFEQELLPNRPIFNLFDDCKELIMDVIYNIHTEGVRICITCSDNFNGSYIYISKHPLEDYKYEIVIVDLVNNKEFIKEVITLQSLKEVKEIKDKYIN